MADRDFLKEYFVKIGWDLDERGLNLADIKSGKFVDKFFSKASKMQLEVAHSVELALSSIAVIAKRGWDLLSEVEDKQDTIELQAKKWMTSVENARAIQNSMDLLGWSNYQELFWATEEERNNFLELYNLGRSLEAPAGLQETLDLVNDIKLSIDKLRLTASYFWQWVAYNIGEEAKGELEYWKVELRNIVNWVVQRLPKAANMIGTTIGKYMRAASQVLKVVARIAKGLYDTFANASKFSRELLILITAIFTLFKGHPFLIILELFRGLVALITDFQDFMAGKDSNWDWSFFVEGTTKLSEALGKLNKALGVLFGYEGDLGFLQVLIDTFGALAETAATIVGWITKLIKLLPKFKTPEGYDKKPKNANWAVPEGGEMVFDLPGFLNNMFGKNHRTNLLDALQTSSRMYTTNNNSSSVNMDSHDVYNVGSVEDIGTIQTTKRNILGSLNGHTQPVFQ